MPELQATSLRRLTTRRNWRCRRPSAPEGASDFELPSMTTQADSLASGTLDLNRLFGADEKRERTRPAAAVASERRRPSRPAMTSRLKSRLTTLVLDAGCA
jgi:hypothetical protein